MKYEPQEKNVNSYKEIQKKRIKFYEERLEKVKAAWSDNWKGESYISFAEKELEEVKLGRR